MLKLKVIAVMAGRNEKLECNDSILAAIGAGISSYGSNNAKLAAFSHQVD